MIGEVLRWKSIVTDLFPDRRDSDYVRSRKSKMTTRRTVVPNIPSISRSSGFRLWVFFRGATACQTSFFDPLSLTKISVNKIVPIELRAKSAQPIQYMPKSNVLYTNMSYYVQFILFYCFQWSQIASSSTQMRHGTILSIKTSTPFTPIHHDVNLAFYEAIAWISSRYREITEATAPITTTYQRLFYPRLPDHRHSNTHLDYF